jgi:O-antigen/teichoic acid export membrane protein
VKAHGTTTAVRWNAATTVVMTTCQIFQVVFLAHWLSPAQFGLAAVAVSILISLQGFCDLGLTNALVQREHVPQEGWTSALWATLLTGLALAGVLFAAAWPLEAGLRLPGLAFLLFWTALALPFAGPASIFQAHLQRHLRFRRLATAEMGGALASVGVTVWWASQRHSTMALIAGQLALAIFRFSSLWVFSKFRYQWRFRWADIVPLSAFGGYQLGEKVLQFVGSNLDRVLVARLLGPAAVGYYSMASQLALRPAALLGPFISRTLLPLMARLQSERSRMIAAYLRSLSALSFVSALIYSLLFGLADPLVLLVLGPKWEGVVLTLRILSVVGFLNILGYTLEVLLLSLARARTGFWLNAGMLATRLGSLAIGAQFGLTGMATALAILMVAWLPFDILLPRHWIGIPAGHTALAMSWIFMPGVLTAGGLAWAVTRVNLGPFWEVSLLGMGGLTLFLALAWVFDRKRLREIHREALTHFLIKRGQV